MHKGFKLAMCQVNVERNKRKNIQNALRHIDLAAQGDARIVILPEMFVCPYDKDVFEEYSENADDGETVYALSKKAKDLGIYIFGGSIPEKENDKIFNTCFVFSKDGKIIGRHRKIHLFDIDVKNGIRFKESDVLTAGDKVTVIETEFCKIGVAICYDIRFPELSRKMTLMGAEFLVFPGAFNMTTGPAHWELSIRMRALDNQVYLAAVSPARDRNASYVAYGNSMIADPWGSVFARADIFEKIVFAEISKGKIARIRNELPLLKQRREDI